MKEKKRAEKTVGGGGGGSVFDGAPALPENKDVAVASGPYAETLPIAGTSVGEVRRKFSDRFDIDPKSQAIVNGNAVDDDAILKSGESLMFIRHAGEKGANSYVQIAGNTAKAIMDDTHTASMPLSDLVRRIGPGMSTGMGIVPNGVRAIMSRGNQTLVVWERPPHVASLQWIAEDSPRPYGQGTKYRTVRISLPYLIIVAAFTRNNGVPVLNTGSNECFFRNESLRSLDDELLYPALPNCSVMKSPQAPLAWICTQYIQMNKQQKDPLSNGLEAVRYCLLETAFNLSSEHHEGNSWFGASKVKIPQVSTVEKWEQETDRDPLFAINVPWLPTGHTVNKFADRTFKRLGAADTSVNTADDVARIIING